MLDLQDPIPRKSLLTVGEPAPWFDGRCTTNPQFCFDSVAGRYVVLCLHLNTGEYEGGQLRFLEFGRQLYTAPVGGAVVFSCSLLHEAMPVTRGNRYMFLPFLYDDDAAKIRQQNRQFLTDDPPENG